MDEGGRERCQPAAEGCALNFGEGGVRAVIAKKRMIRA